MKKKLVAFLTMIVMVTMLTACADGTSENLQGSGSDTLVPVAGTESTAGTDAPLDTQGTAQTDVSVPNVTEETASATNEASQTVNADVEEHKEETTGVTSGTEVQDEAKTIFMNAIGLKRELNATWMYMEMPMSNDDGSETMTYKFDITSYVKGDYNYSETKIIIDIAGTTLSETAEHTYTHKIGNEKQVTLTEIDGVWDKKEVDLDEMMGALTELQDSYGIMPSGFYDALSTVNDIIADPESAEQSLIDKGIYDTYHFYRIGRNGEETTLFAKVNMGEVLDVIGLGESWFDDLSMDITVTIDSGSGDILSTAGEATLSFEKLMGSVLAGGSESENDYLALFSGLGLHFGDIRLTTNTYSTTIFDAEELYHEAEYEYSLSALKNDVCKEVASDYSLDVFDDTLDRYLDRTEWFGDSSEQAASLLTDPKIIPNTNVWAYRHYEAEDMGDYALYTTNSMYRTEYYFLDVVDVRAHFYSGQIDDVERIMCMAGKLGANNTWEVYSINDYEDGQITYDLQSDDLDEVLTDLSPLFTTKELDKCLDVEYGFLYEWYDYEEEEYIPFPAAYVYAYDPSREYEGVFEMLYFFVYTDEYDQASFIYDETSYFADVYDEYPYKIVSDTFNFDCPIDVDHYYHELDDMYKAQLTVRDQGNA